MLITYFVDGIYISLGPSSITVSTNRELYPEILYVGICLKGDEDGFY